MRKLLSLLFVLALGWGGYWVVVSQGVKGGLSNWLEDRQAEGWQAETSEIRTAGFPARFQTTLTDVALADPDTGLAVELPTVGLSAAMTSPTRITLALPTSQTIATPDERIEISATRMDGVLDVAPGTALALREGTVLFEGVSLASNAGWSAALAGGTLSAKRTDAEANRYDILFEANAFRPAEPLILQIDPTELLPRVIDEMRLDADIRFDAPWDRFAVEGRRPQPREIGLRKLRALWGDLELEAAGDLEIDTEGRPTGRISVRAVNWRDMLAVAKASGAVPDTFAGTIERALEVLAGLSGRPDTIDAPLSFQNGFMSFGPLPLGPAPRFVIR